MNSKTAYIWEVIFEYFPLITHPATQVFPFMLTNRIHEYLKINYMSIEKKTFMHRKVLTSYLTRILHMFCEFMFIQTLGVLERRKICGIDFKIFLI